MTNLPICPKKEFKSSIHGLELLDNYHWLRDDNWPDVDAEILSYLQEENAYTEKMASNFANLEEQLFQEMKQRIIEEDSSYPITHHYQNEIYSYYSKTMFGEEHRIYCRKHKDKEEVLLNVNLLAGNNKAFSLGDLSISHDHRKIVYSEDATGKERFSINIKNLSTGEFYQEKIENTIDSIVWNKDSSGFYYLKLDDNWIGNRVYFHLLEADSKNDLLIYHEKDAGFHLSLSLSSQEDFLLIDIVAKDRNETRSISLDSKDHVLEIIIDRDKGYLYQADYHNGILYLLLNDLGRNFRLVKQLNGRFIELIAHSQKEYLTDMFFTNGHLIITEKSMGLDRFLIYKNDISCDKITFGDEPYEASTIYTTYDSKFLRLNYSSPVCPETIMEYEFSSKKIHKRKISPVPNYDANLYEAKRIWVKARDGVQIPVTMMYSKDTKLQNAPLLLYGYGSYGISIPADFRASRAALLDHGFIYAIAHIRGGDELGFDWYEQAKFLNKKVTFTDFVDVINYLIAQNITIPQKLAIMGGSAGGMLVGYMLNQHPDLFASCLALVPFVDVLNTMLDENLPLTQGEFQEWGNPKNKEYFDYIKSYSPYDNIKQQNYPHILITAGINDPRVTYWEATKFVAKLREFKTDDNLLLYKIELEQGHKGQYGKYNALKEMAFYYAFIIHSLKNIILRVS